MNRRDFLKITPLILAGGAAVKTMAAITSEPPQTTDDDGPRYDESPLNQWSDRYDADYWDDEDDLPATKAELDAGWWGRLSSTETA